MGVAVLACGNKYCVSIVRCTVLGRRDGIKTGLAGNSCPVFHVLLSNDREDLMRVSACCRFAAVLLLLAAFPLFAQNQQDTLFAPIQHEDAVFWDAYNSCD